jgi:hypothetical protein
MPNTSAAARARWIAERLIWWPLLVGIGYAWYLFGIRLTHRLGPDQLSQAVGLMLAVSVVVTIWCWSAWDSRRLTIETGTCPRCYVPVTPYEYPPIPGVREEALHGWHCDNCGLEDVHPLTDSPDPS